MENDLDRVKESARG